MFVNAVRVSPRSEAMGPTVNSRWILTDPLHFLWVGVLQNLFITVHVLMVSQHQLLAMRLRESWSQPGGP